MQVLFCGLRCAIAVTIIYVAVENLVRCRSGAVLPHRTMDPLKLSDIRDVAQRSEVLGFSDLLLSNPQLPEKMPKIRRLQRVFSP